LETASALRAAEGLALVMLCQCRLPPRRVSALILKEVKLLLKAFGKFLLHDISLLQNRHYSLDSLQD
jgi:hypothetical protein